MKRTRMNPNLTRGPVTERKSRYSQPKMSSLNGDTSVVAYRLPGRIEDLYPVIQGTGGYRLFAGGNRSGLPGGGLTFAGVDIVSKYNTCKFLPGTTITWEPSIGSNNPGRLHYCFVDSPEMVYTLTQLAAAWELDSGNIIKFNAYQNAIATCGNACSFPLWMEKSIQVPTKLRRREFTVDPQLEASGDNRNSITSSYDRSVQVGFFYFIVAPNTVPSTVGSFIYSDKVQVSGLSGVTNTGGT